MATRSTHVSHLILYFILSILPGQAEYVDIGFLATNFEHEGRYYKIKYAFLRAKRRAKTYKLLREGLLSLPPPHKSSDQTATRSVLV